MSSSILTNLSAMSAVQNLNNTQSQLAGVQNEISTGLKVSSAQDDAAYWSIATNMRTQNNDLSTVSSSLNLGSSVLGTANAALTNMLTVLQTMSADIVKAQTAGTDQTAIQTQLTQLQSQLNSSITSASFNGVNLLDGSASGGVSIVSSVTGSGANLTSSLLNVAGYSFGVADAAGTTNASDSLDGVGAASFTLASTTNNQVDNLAKIGTAIAAVQAASETIGATQNNLTIQSTFISSLSDSLTTGIGSLVDADMNEASTRLNALQTQQQLGIQALSVANQNSQLILKLFQ